MSWRDTLQEHFPKALVVGDLATRLRLTLLGEGLTPEKVLFGNVLCRDELNTPTVRRFAKDWGENFSLAGLGGYPTAGRTGIGAYASHLPSDGTLLVLYGPHVGIDEEGHLGQAERDGMPRATAACGALLQLQSRLAADGEYYPDDDPLDIEQVAFERGVLESIHVDPNITLMDAAYTAIDYELSQLMPFDLYPKQVRIGGVLVNTPSAGDDHFEVRRAIHARGSGEPTDLMPKLMDADFRRA